MSAVNYETGEIVEYDRAAAERRAERIRLRLDSIADNYAAVMPMIREAIEKRDDLALGYRSVSEYVSDRFGGALTRLGVEVRREVVRELTEAGMSTRAIAPVVGVSQMQVSRDRAAGETSVTPDPIPNPKVDPQGALDAVIDRADETFKTPAGEQAPNPVNTSAFAEPGGAVDQPRPPVTGIDGKTYKRPEPKARPFRTPQQQNAEEFAVRFAGQIFSLQSMKHAHMRADALNQWAAGREAVSPIQRPYASPEHIRIAAHGLLALADEWEQRNV